MIFSVNTTAEDTDLFRNHTSQYVEQSTNFSSQTAANNHLTHFTNFTSTFSYPSQSSTGSISLPLSTSNFQYSQATNVTDLITESTIFHTPLRLLTSERVFITTPQDPEITLLDDVGTYLWRIFSPIIFLLGIIGNGFILAVLRRMRFWKKPSLFILAPLAFTDMTVLCTGLSRYWIINTFDFDIRARSNVGCKIYLFVLYISMQYSSWICVCFTTERFLKTNYPFRHRIFITVKKEAIALCFIIIVLIGIDGHYFWSNGLVNNGTECSSISDSFKHFEDFYFTYIDFTVLSALPALLMVIMNVKIALALKRSREFVQMAAFGRASDNYQRFNRNLTRMLLITNTYFVLATIPISVYFIIDSYTEDVTGIAKSQKGLAKAVVYIFQYTNYAVNFLLYTSSNAQFRKHLKAMLNRGNSVRINRSAQSSTNTSSTRVEDNSNTVTETTEHEDSELDGTVAESDINIQMNIPGIGEIPSSENNDTKMNSPEESRINPSGNGETEINILDKDQINPCGNDKTKVKTPKIDPIQNCSVIGGDSEKNNFKQSNNDPVQVYHF